MVGAKRAVNEEGYRSNPCGVAQGIIECNFDNAKATLDNPWCNAAPNYWGLLRVLRGHGVQRGRFREERYNFLVVPVDEDMTRRGGHVGCATLWKERRGETDFKEASCIQREYRQKFERKELG